MSTIAAISTAHGVGGIGVIRISGKDATKIADKVFVPFAGEAGSCLKNLKGYSAKYGKILDKSDYIDDAVALVFKSPYSYTGEDVVELSCHGGLFLTKRVLRAVLDAGATPALPGEFTKRAFLNGKMDLSQAEAVMDLISAKGKRANQVAFQMREGHSSERINQIKEKLIDVSAGLSVWADYPEEDIPQVDEKVLNKDIKAIIFQLDEMIKNYDVFKSVKDGVKTAIVGRPNVGKSTLMNLLSDSQKSIVTDIPGTTRDSIEETIMVGDIPVLLIDTAGIRKTDDKVEKIGVERAKKHMNEAEITLFMIDASSPFCEEDKLLLKEINEEKTIFLLNKCDISNAKNLDNLSTYLKENVEFKDQNPKIIKISALKGEGTEKLKEYIEEIVGISKVDPSETVISNERQLASLKKAKSILEEAIKELEIGITLDAVTVLLQDALVLFMEFTGESVSEAVVNKVFSKFCVGK